ncbi:MAG: Cof-type HAD-IIB family hydrolase [Beduini sp.]
MKYKLIALDLDGTLKTSQNTIGSKTKAALLKCQELGMKIVLASGRPTPGLRHESNQLKLKENDGYILSFNGAKVHSESTGEVIYEKVLTNLQAKKMIKRAKDFKLAPMTYLGNDLVSDMCEDFYVIGEAKLNDMGLKSVDDLDEFVDFDPHKVLLAADPDYVASVLDDFKTPYESELSIYRSAAHYIEIMAQNIDKATSLDCLVKHLGIKQEEVIAFGDGYNDLSMIEYAGLGVAMGNSVEGVKEKADVVTKTNDEEGIAYLLSQIIEGVDF